MLTKSYKGLILWMIAFFALMLALSFLPVKDENLMMRIVGFFCMVGLEGLMLLIYKTEKVFWINGVSYQDALEAGSDRRRAYALKYVKRFGILTVGVLVFSVIAHLLHLSAVVDTLLLVAGNAVVAFSTMRIKL